MRDDSNHFVTSAKANSTNNWEVVQNCYKFKTKQNLKMSSTIEQLKISCKSKATERALGSYFIYQMADRPLVDNLS
jgi:hypothetical protein